MMSQSVKKGHNIALIPGTWLLGVDKMGIVTPGLGWRGKFAKDVTSKRYYSPMKKKTMWINSVKLCYKSTGSCPNNPPTLARKT
jgi:hypothetical protein